MFQDEHGDFPVGTYVCNPINTERTPVSEPGCETFVKIWQFDPSETEILRIDMNTVELQPSPDNAGVSTALLFSDNREQVMLEQWEADTEISLHHSSGVEVLIIEGSFLHNDENLIKHSWLRLPKDDSLTVKAGAQGARV